MTQSTEWGIIPCTTCEGSGEVWNGRGKGGVDPDSWNIECSDCAGLGCEPCEACGNTVRVGGFDCFACEVVGMMPSDCAMTQEQIEILQTAVGYRMATACGATVPPIGGAA
jgi:hypothetical protein